MDITPAVVSEEYERVRDRADIPKHITIIRGRLGDLFGVDVDPVDTQMYQSAVDDVFADGDVGVNVATLVRVLRDLDCEDDYPGFVVDEFLGRRLAATIAGGEPYRLLAEATFHFADVHIDDTDATAGGDDLTAALVAGFQTRIPGWSWTETESPFRVDLLRE